MNDYSQYLKDKDFVTHLHDMARKYDSPLLRKVADRMDDLIEENKRNEQSARMETMGHRKFT